MSKKFIANFENDLKALTNFLVGVQKTKPTPKRKGTKRDRSKSKR